jgi:hypothetical protein
MAKNLLPLHETFSFIQQHLYPPSFGWKNHKIELLRNVSR